jgi:hypothetical protein
VLYAMRVLRAQSLETALPVPPAAPDPANVAHPDDYAGQYASSDGKALRVVAQGSRLVLLDGAKSIALYPRGDDTFWADDPQYATFSIVFGRDAAHRIVELTYGSQWYPNERYRGPRTFSHPSAWNALLGRYENVYYGSPFITRVLIVKNHLTLDGTSVLKPLPDGAFALGSSVVRFDAYTGKQPQRLSIDETALYRIELP